MKRIHFLCLTLLLLAVPAPTFAALVHRYSFTTDASDSVGGANGTLSGVASVAGNAVVLDGLSGYVDLPNDLVSNLTSITIETWVTDAGSAGWARVFDFGRSVGGEDQQGGGINYMFLSLPTGGGSLRAAYNAGAGEQNLDVTRPPVGQPAHLVWTSDAATSTGSLYVNGIRAGVITNLTITPASIGSTFNDWLGRSQYDDPYFNGSIDEFRIYDSAVSPLQAAVDTVIGPDTLYSDPGPAINMVLSVNTNVVVGNIQRASVVGDFNTVSNVNLSTAVTYASDNTNVVALLDATGRIAAVGPGTAKLTATLGSVSVSASIAVAAVPPKMVHRYSFTADGSDSVGGANGTLLGGAIVQNNSVVLDGVSGYVDLPNGILTNLNSITVETWVTDNGSGAWARIYDLGNSSGGEDNPAGGTQYMFLSEPANAGNLRGAYTISGGGAGEQILDWVGNKPPVGQEAHIVWTTDALSHTGRLYVNGSQVVVNANVTLTPADFGETLNNWLGRSQFSADAYFNGSFNEFRIYDAALSPLQVAVDAATGPDTIVTNTGNLQSISLNVSSNMASGTIQRALVLGNFANVTNVNLSTISTYSSGNTNILTVDASGTIRAVGVGTTTISAGYGGLTNSQTITSVLRPAVLSHRYSFNSDVTDSVGGANGSLVGTATISNGALVLDGGGAASLPPALIDTNYDAVTIEAWARISITPDGAATHLYGFGSTNAAGGPLNFLRYRVHSAGNNNIVGIAAPGEQTASSSGPVAGDVHLAIIYNPSAGSLAYYINGQIGNSNTVSTLLNSVRGTNDVVNYIGRHVDGSGGMVGSVNEFRIYNGALSVAQLRTSLAAGPSNAVFDAGTIQSVSVSFYPNFINGTIQLPRVRANSASVTNIDLTGVSGVTYSSSDTNILQVLADGRVRATGVGAATITATYQGVSGIANVTVIPQQTLLTHRYSFTNDASDSVGAADGALMGFAAVSAGSVNLDASAGRGSYVNLPSNLIDGYQSITIESWVNLSANGIWSRIFDFGNYNAGGGGQYYLFLCPRTAGATVRSSFNDGAGEQNVDLGAAFGTLDTGTPRHVAVVFSPGTQSEALYVDGVLAGQSLLNPARPLSNLVDLHNFIGRSMYTGDSFLNGSVDEFRIYYGALTASQVATNFAAGPDTVVPITPPAPRLSARLSGGNIVITWPDTSTGFTLEYSTALGPTASWAAVPETPVDSGGVFTVSEPVTQSGTRFFRLHK